MDDRSESAYSTIRSGATGFYEHKRGLMSVHGKEAVQFLDGMITNDMKTLEDGQQMLAAFPNAQGRLIALVRILRQGETFFIETEDATREKLYQNLFRFTFAGDFFVDDISDQYRYIEIFASVDGSESRPVGTLAGGVKFFANSTSGHFIPIGSFSQFRSNLLSSGAVEISDNLYETLRIESGIPKFGVDMDETTIVPELGVKDLISYTKGCYIGQEIIARIHFRGHVAKQLTGLILSEPPALAGGLLPGVELRSTEGKNAGRITSVAYSPNLEKMIGFAYVRYDYLTEGTELLCNDQPAIVKSLPFFR